MEPFYQEAMATIYCGNALEVLKSLPSESVQMAMTSPPYYGLRNYAGGSDVIWGGEEDCQHDWVETTQGLQHENRNNLIGTQEEVVGKTGTTFIQKYDRLPAGLCRLCGSWRGQLGLEPTPELFVSHLIMIFREVKRVLRKDGSFYLNIGDTYAGSWGDSGHRPERTGIEGHQRTKSTKWLERKGHPQMNIPPTRQCLALTPIQPKCMICVPERLMFAMIEDDWILRNKICWHKPNAMPSSVKDRFTASWEYLYFFTKARKYYFDLDAVREPHKTQSLERYQRQVNFGDKTPNSKYAGSNPYPEGVQPIYREGRNLCPDWFKEMYPEDKDYKGKFDDLFGHGPNPQSFNLRVRDVKRGKGGTFVEGGKIKELKASEKEVEEYEYPEKHHGSSMSNEASLHRDRQKHESVDLGAQKPARKRHSGYFGEDGQALDDFAKGKNPGDYWDITTQPSSICVCPKCEAVFPRYIKVCPRCNIEGVVGHFAPYPIALCERPIKASTRVGDVVLDPLAGGGNTSVAAKKLGRKCILIDCVKEYCIMARHKLSKIEYQPELLE